MAESRYQKHIKLKGFGKEGQDRLSQAKVLILGAGGLGTPAAQYLNGVGVGTLGIMDLDVIEESNLPRQTLYSPHQIGLSKTDSLIQWLHRQNPATQLINHQAFITPENALGIISKYDLVIDATDNFGTRYLVNDACVILDKPFVYGAIHDFEGQVSVMNYQDGPTYRCLFPESDQNLMIPNCDENGVLGVLPGLIGTYQALEAIKVITGIGEPLVGKLLIIDTLAQTHFKIGVSAIPQNKNIKELKPNYHQPVCGSDNTVKHLSPEAFYLRLKKNFSYQLVDVRTTEEFEQYHLEQAIHIPLQELQNRHLELDQGKDLILLCQSGKRSLQAANFLHEAYPTAKIFNVSGGINALESSAKDEA
ncbi:HesA/MoeB/ThiF family protein [Echinicola sp. 20G]|uniref:HesA/MoeB/ThiF family protein n=1 Tax=Echinicola sp. 20G TaxID=2781961 RepID=UPI0019100FC2|nr:HesA/MoeB/ThiF family protein [Echinicola sp. 20G]